MRTVARLAAAGSLVLVISLPATGAAADEVTVSIGDRLDPAELDVPAGTAVTWVNDDDGRHRVRSRDGALEFDSGNLEPGESFTFVFDATGEHRYVDERDRDDPAYHGMVTVTPAGGTSGTDPSGGDGSPAGSGDPAGSMSGEAGPTREDVAILDRSFSPGSVTIAPGTTVTWSNRSDREHTVTFTSGGGSGELAGGASFSRKFDASGTFEYLCAIHPEMTGSVTVTGAGTGPSGGDGGPPTSGPTAPAAPTSSASPDAAAGADGQSRTSGTAAGNGTVRIVDLAFEPDRVTLDAGGTVTWTNQGVAPHTVTGDGFDSGTIRAGAHFSRRFDSPGTYPYRCTLHPQMTGTVVVQAAGRSPSGVADARSTRSPGGPAGGGGMPGLLASFVLGLGAGVAGTLLRR